MVDEEQAVKVYDPRLDTTPGAHPQEERCQVDTRNPALIAAALSTASVNWFAIVEAANYCDAEVSAPIVVDDAQGSKDSR